MVGANYTGGRRNAAKVRSKDTTASLQRGHFSKQRLGILIDALRSRGPDHRPPTDNHNLTTNPRESGSFVPPSGYSTCAPLATIYDISLGHARRDLARKQLKPRQSTYLNRNNEPSTPQPERPHPVFPPTASVEPSITAPAGKSETDSASSLHPLLPPVVSKPSTSEPVPENKSTRNEVPSKPRSRILDLIDASDREH